MMMRGREQRKEGAQRIGRVGESGISIEKKRDSPGILMDLNKLLMFSHRESENILPPGPREKMMNANY